MSMIMSVRTRVPAHNVIIVGPGKIMKCQNVDPIAHRAFNSIRLTVLTLFFFSSALHRISAYKWHIKWFGFFFLFLCFALTKELINNAGIWFCFSISLSSFIRSSFFSFSFFFVIFCHFTVYISLTDWCDCRSKNCKCLHCEWVPLLKWLAWCLTLKSHC